jgi:hypothetical protein
LNEDESPPEYINENSYTKSLTDSNLTLVGEWPWGQCKAVAIRDSLAIIGNGKLIQFMDISDPTSPKVAAEYNTGGLVRGLALRDSLAFICSGGNLIILNISNIFSLVQVGYISLGSPKEVVPTDSFAYVLEDPLHAPWVTIVDITDPSNPRIRSSAGVAADWPVHIAVRNRYIYVTGYNWPFLTIIDARDPDYLVHQDAWLGTSAICIRDTFIYVGVGSSLGIYSISDPIQPIFLDTAYSGVLHSLHTIDVIGHYAYASNDSGVFVYNISDPYNAFFVSRLATISGTWLAGNDTLLHIASESGYNIVSTSNVDSMYEVGKFYTGGKPYDIAIQGNLAYVATGRPGLTILDLSNPTVPVRIGALDFGKMTYKILIKDTTAYVGSDSAVNIINISSTVNPIWINQTITPASYGPSGMYIDEQRLYCLIASTGTAIYDISTPSQLQYLGFNNFAGRQIIVRDKIAYHAGGTGGFVIVDVHDPNNSTVLSTFPCYAKSICLKDSFAFIADAIGLYSINISNPSTPESLSYISTPTSDYSTNIVLSGKYLYFASSTLSIIDVSDPYSPKIVGISSIGGYKFAVYDKYIYITGDLNIAIFKNELITSAFNEKDPISNEFQLYPNYPNPFNSTTMIKYSIPRPDYVSISIYDVIGRIIETLDIGFQFQGDYEYQWNPENISAGLYFIKLTVGKFTIIKKALLIK